MKRTIDKLTCCYENEMPDNCVHINLNTKVLRHGDCKLSDGQIKDIISFLSSKLFDYAQNGGDMSNYQPKAFSHFYSAKTKNFQATTNR